MTDFPVPLDNLIAYVKALPPRGRAAGQRGGRVRRLRGSSTSRPTRCIGYFVDQARRSGLAWSQIGSRMGVSKQAAQKRFVPRASAPVPDETAAAVLPVHRACRPERARAAAAADRRAPDPIDRAATWRPACSPSRRAWPPRSSAERGLTPEQIYAAVGAGPRAAGPDTDTGPCAS